MPRLMLLVLLLLPSLAAQAHQNKSYDQNGGHYDDFGTYHCHLDGCVLTESRHQARRRIGNSRDREKFYNKEDWPYWEDFDNDCQDARAEVLVITSRVPVSYTNPRNCVVKEGLWLDEYSGEEFTRALDLEIDHIIPPRYADTANGYQWDQQKRSTFANDPMNLIAVSRKTFREKRQRSIALWRPRAEYLCSYASQWRDIAEKYQLRLFNRESGRINSTLKDCGPEGPFRSEDPPAP
ncbi:MAG: DUF1524 domain-containing protein [Pseudomonadales bacterium]|nr:DUF1524 domain-containing protein [Pseudomonadales bacterium]